MFHDKNVYVYLSMSFVYLYDWKSNIHILERSETIWYSLINTSDVI